MLQRSARRAQQAPRANPQLLVCLRICVSVHGVAWGPFCHLCMSIPICLSGRPLRSSSICRTPIASACTHAVTTSGHFFTCPCKPTQSATVRWSRSAGCGSCVLG